MRMRFLVLTAIWGASFLFIKIGLEALAPAQLVLARLVTGALVVTAVMVIRGERWPRSPRLWAHMAVAATLLNTVPFMLIAYAEQRLPTVVASICNATTPLFTVAIAAFALPDERPTARRVLGLVVGFAGVFIVLGAWRAHGPDPRLAALVLAAAACYAAGGVYLRKATAGSGHSGVSLTAVQLALGAAQMAVVAPLTTSMPAAIPLHVILAIATLGMLGTGLAYVLQYELLRRAGATLTSTITYCLPLVSIALGVLVLGEQLTWNAPLGAAIVIAGALFARSAGGYRPLISQSIASLARAGRNRRAG
jgi:drug/metabolite transporter (DMT)-like permease